MRRNMGENNINNDSDQSADPQSPMVSVIMPAYNRERLIEKSVKSVINQAYQNWELLIVDDRSQDNTKNVILKLAEQDHRIKYLLNQRKKGPGGARNYGILNARGKYLAFLDSDDEWLPHHLEKGVRIMENEQVSVCFALWLENRFGKIVNRFEQAAYINLFNSVKRSYQFSCKDDLVFIGRNFLECITLTGYFCYHINSLILNRNVLLKTGLFNEGFPMNEDTHFIFKIFQHYGFCLIKDYHFIYNFGDDNLYAFMDRSRIDIPKILGNDELIHKISLQCIYKIKLLRNLKSYFMKDKLISRRELCIKKINADISKKYFTLGYLNAKKKRKPFFFYCKSLYYEFRSEKLKYLFGSLFPGWFNEIPPERKFLDLW